MTPLNLRRRIRSALTILRGVSPDEAAEVRAAYRVAYDCGDDEPIADLMRQAVSDAAYWTRAWERRGKELDAMERELTLLRGVGSGGSAATQALNAIAAACGCAEWEYPGQVVRDVEAVVRERDEAVALISTVRAELAAAVEERDRLREALRPVADGNPGWTMVEDHNRARDVLAGTSTPKRKRTKEDGFPHRVGDQWVVKVLRASGRAMTSREIATEIDSTMVPTYMRWVSDLARAGYLTVAKGPGGVRVYSLKEGA